MKLSPSTLPPEEELQKAIARALKLLSYRPRTEKEIRIYLLKREFRESTIEKTIELLKLDKLIDDKEFAEWWIDQRQSFKPKGRSVLKQELSQKGVADTLIEKTISENQDDLKIATDLFNKKKDRFANFSGQEYKKKVSDFLFRRGFSWDIIMKIIKEDDI